MFGRLRSSASARQRAYDETNIFDIHKIVVRNLVEREEHYVYASLEDAEARRNPRILLYINGEFATALTLAAVKEKLLIRGFHKATLQIVAPLNYARCLEGQRRVDSSLDCYWDYNHPCRHCGKVFMYDESPRTMCCNDGKFYYGDPQSPISALTYWPAEISKLYYARSTEFFEKSVDIVRWPFPTPAGT